MSQLLQMSLGQALEPDSPFDRLYHGACEDVLPTLPDACVDLIVTSPPYADQRKRTYGGIPPDDYVAWFLPIAAQLKRVLKPTGSFILNIKERVVAGERHTYVLELILALRKQGWLWTAVMLPMGDWADKRLSKLSETDQRRDESRVKSGFGKNISNWVGRQLVYPTNVLHLATECSNRGHRAAFPVALPEWFIKLFTQAGDVVLDPFIGSGTTAVAAQQLGRRWIGIEKEAEYIQVALRRLTERTTSFMS